MLWNLSPTQMTTNSLPWPHVPLKFSFPFPAKLLSSNLFIVTAYIFLSPSFSLAHCVLYLHRNHSCQLALPTTSTGVFFNPLSWQSLWPILNDVLSRGCSWAPFLLCYPSLNDDLSSHRYNSIVADNSQMYNFTSDLSLLLYTHIYRCFLNIPIWICIIHSSLMHLKHNSCFPPKLFLI